VHDTPHYLEICVLNGENSFFDYLFGKNLFQLNLLVFKLLTPNNEAKAKHQFMKSDG